MTAQPRRRSERATLSPVATCWWERVGDCTYLVLYGPGLLPGLTRGRRIALTGTEAEILRDLLNDPEWWSDRNELLYPPKGAHSHAESERI